MNRQAGYIFNAILILLFAGVLTWFIELMPAAKSNNNSSLLTDFSTDPSVTLNGNAAKGKALFMSKCASCHHPFKEMTGPALKGFAERGPWANRKDLYAWIRDPSGFIKKNEYTRELRVKYKITMTAFKDITDEEVDAICAYLQ